MGHSHSHDDHDHPHGHGHSHSHSHAGHSHDHSSLPQKIGAAFLIAIVMNLAFMGFEVVYALISHSMGLLADAAHNLADVLGLALAYGANQMQRWLPGTRFTYGFKRTSILAALANSLILVASSAIIAYESILHWIYPMPVQASVMMWVAAIGIVINAGSGLLFMKNAAEDLNVKGAFVHLMSDALMSAGVIVAGALILWTGKTWIDPLAGLLIVIVIFMGTWNLLKQSLNFVLDGVPSGINTDTVRAFLQALPGVAQVHDLHIWGLSTRETALTAHLVMPGNGLSDADYQQINETLKKQFKIQHVTLQVEQSAVPGTACERVGGCL